MPSLSGQDEALDSLITGHQWKEAFKLCEKKLKKAKKIWILICWPDQARKEQGFRELDALLQRTPPVADIETLLFLDSFESPKELQGIPLGGQIGKNLSQIWSNAAGSRPQDEKLLAQWYRTKFEMGDMEGARQASFAWQKNFPKTRKPFFLWILALHLLSESSVMPEMMQRVHGAVAYRNISKAAQVTIDKKPDTDTAKRGIRTLEDILFLIRIYRGQGKNQEAIEIINDAFLGDLVEAGKDSWSLLMQMLDLLERSQMWEKLHSFCCEALLEFLQTTKTPLEAGNSRYGRQGDDWKIWQAFLKANEKMNGQSYDHQAVLYASADCNRNANELSKILYPINGETRNVRLARLGYYATEVSAGRRVPDDLWSAVCSHFHDYSHKFICFHDLKPYLSFLNRQQQERLLIFASEHAQKSKPGPGESDSERISWITAEINARKLEYNLVVSTNKNKNWDHLLVAFISNCLRLYRVSLLFKLRLPATDRRPGDDASILAAMGLVRLYRSRIPAYNNALLRAILVLELLLRHSYHNYDALLILLRIYMFYGAGSQAMARYCVLSMKNMQNASLSWLLHTRISTIHPNASILRLGDGRFGKTVDPWTEVLHAQRWFGNCHDLSRRAIRLMEDEGQWNMILDTLDLGKLLDSSFSRYLLFAESMRIGRLRGINHDASDLLLPIPPQTNDTRDRTPFPNFENGHSTFEASIPMVGTSVAVNDRWLWSEFMLTRLWQMLHNDGFSSIREEDLTKLKDRCGELPDSCTREEDAVNQVVLLLYELYGCYNLKRRTKPPPNATGDYVKEMLETLEKWLGQVTELLETTVKSGHNASAALTSNLEIPHWQYYHARFTYLELCKMVTATLKYALAENRNQAEKQKRGSKPFAPPHLMEMMVPRILSQCRDLTTLIHRSAGELRLRLQGPATLQEIHRAVVGQADDLEDLIGREFHMFDSNEILTRICKDIQESWIEGLKGILDTKAA